MHPRRFLLGLLAVGLVAVAPAGCGAPAPAPAPVRWMEAKPTPVVDGLQAAVLERPAPDRAWVAARWNGTSLPGACTVDLQLPVGVLLVDGPEAVALDPEQPAGEARWLVEFPRDGRELDAVVRYCVETPEGLRVAHCAVRLTP